MHEMSVAESMLDVISDQLGGRVELLTCSIVLGPLSGISADSLQFCFTEVSRQLGFGSPELIVRKVPAQAHCNECGRDYAMENAFDLCPDCKSLSRSVQGGDDFAIESVEIAEDAHV